MNITNSKLDALQARMDKRALAGKTIERALRGIMEDIAEDDCDRKRAALLLWLRQNGDDDSPDDVTQTRYSDDTFDAPGAEYRVLTDSEADTAAADYVKDSLWAFNASFLSGETGIDDSVFAALADKCEGANDAIESIIRGTCGIDSFVESAVGADGRGHFISQYDGEENDCGEFYIYRVN